MSEVTMRFNKTDFRDLIEIHDIQRDIGNNRSTSMRVFKSFTSVVISSGILSLVCFLLGMMASYQFSTPAGASVVVVNLIAFGLFSMWQVLGKKR